MVDVLKGNFQVKRPVCVDEPKQAAVVSDSDPKSADEIELALRKAALNSIGGSMVYVERTPLSWDGDDASDE